MSFENASCDAFEAAGDASTAAVDVPPPPPGDDAPWSPPDDAGPVDPQAAASPFMGLFDGPSGSGTGLPAATLMTFATSLGADLGGVRLHTDDGAASASEAVGARAFTVGQDIFFGRGQYDPTSSDGRMLLAHEVVHTVQQAGAPSAAQCKLEVSEPGDALELEADRLAADMLAGRPASVTGTGVTQAARKIMRWATQPPEAVQARIRVQRLIAQAGNVGTIANTIYALEQPNESNGLVTVHLGNDNVQLSDLDIDPLLREARARRDTLYQETYDTPAGERAVGEAIDGATSATQLDTVSHALGAATQIAEGIFSARLGDRTVNVLQRNLAGLRQRIAARRAALARPAPGNPPPGNRPAQGERAQSECEEAQSEGEEAQSEAEPEPAAPVTAPTEDERRSAGTAIRSYHAAATTHSEAHRRWVSANWNDYLTQTSGNPHLSWTQQQLKDAMRGAICSMPSSFVFKESISAAASFTAEELGALLGTEVAPGVGTVIGWLIGRLVTQASSVIYAEITGHTEAGEADRATRLRLGSAIEANEHRLSEETLARLGEIRTATESMHREAEHTGDRNVVVRLTQHARELENGSRRLPDDSNRALSRDMLRTWVLENAGDEEDANAQTSETDWEAVRDDVFRPGDMNWHPEIFAYQTRAHFNAIGLDVPSASIERMIQRADALRQEALTTRQDRSGVAQNEFDGDSFTVSGVSEAFCAFVTESIENHEMDPRWRSRAYVRVTLDLGTDDGSCYVNQWRYRVHYPDGTRGIRSVLAYECGPGLGDRVDCAIDQVVGIPERYDHLTEVEFNHSPD